MFFIWCTSDFSLVNEIEGKNYNWNITTFGAWQTKEKVIAIINYNMGNLRSVEKAFHRLGIEAVITADAAIIQRAEKLVLPGVGHFAKGMEELSGSGLLDLLNEQVLGHGKPVLGICLGMQLLTRHSEEGDAEGLGWIDAKTVRFPTDDKVYRVPHIGWNTLQVVNPSVLYEGISPDAAFYFVHSYYVSAADISAVSTESEYGITFTSSVKKDNIYGTQFHPEKSLNAGLRLLRNFAEGG